MCSYDSKDVKGNSDCAGKNIVGDCLADEQPSNSICDLQCFNDEGTLDYDMKKEAEDNKQSDCCDRIGCPMKELSTNTNYVKLMKKYNDEKFLGDGMCQPACANRYCNYDKQKKIEKSATQKEVQELDDCLNF